jgi:hypothetical protein
MASAGKAGGLLAECVAEYELRAPTRVILSTLMWPTRRAFWGDVSPILSPAKAAQVDLNRARQSVAIQTILQKKPYPVSEPEGHQ